MIYFNYRSVISYSRSWKHRGIVSMFLLLYVVTFLVCYNKNNAHLFWFSSQWCCMLFLQQISGRVSSQLDLSDIQNCRLRSLFDWHYAEHHDASVLPQVTVWSCLLGCFLVSVRRQLLLLWVFPALYLLLNMFISLYCLKSSSSVKETNNRFLDWISSIWLIVFTILLV